MRRRSFDDLPNGGFNNLSEFNEIPVDISQSVPKERVKPPSARIEDLYNVTISELRPRAAVTSLPNAPAMLTFLSQQPGLSFDNMQNTYYAEENPGLGQTIYSLDFGAVLQNVGSYMLI